MRPGDYITVNSSEVELLTSDAFRAVASAELVEKIGIQHGLGGYERLYLPEVGQPVVTALRRLMAKEIPPAEAIVAEYLAERIELRIAHRGRVR